MRNCTSSGLNIFKQINRKKKYSCFAGFLKSKFLQNHEEILKKCFFLKAIPVFQLTSLNVPNEFHIVENLN